MRAPQAAPWILRRPGRLAITSKCFVPSRVQRWPSRVTAAIRKLCRSHEAMEAAALEASRGLEGGLQIGFRPPAAAAVEAAVTATAAAVA